MLKKKIASVVAAMAMAATMSVSALSASAACVHNTDGSCVGNGHFYSWNDANEDGVIDEGELTLSTHADGLISGNPEYDSDTGEVDITFTTLSYGGLTGSVSSITTMDGTSVPIVSDTATITPGTPYKMTITFTGGSHPGGQPTLKVVFIIGDCSDCTCGCNA